MNANLFHNLSNIIILIAAALSAGLIATGCTALPTGSLDCSASWINPAYSGWLIAALSGLKIIVNIGRDGITGLTKPQPPVKR